MGPGNARLFCEFSQSGVIFNWDLEILSFSANFSKWESLLYESWKSSAFLWISQLGVLFSWDLEMLSFSVNFSNGSLC